MKKIIFSAIAVIGLSVSSQNVSARSWRINPSPDAKANFSSITAAMESLDVLNGDTLYIDPGCALGNAWVGKQVTIIGPGYNLQEESTREAIINQISISASNVKIEGCNVSFIVLNRGANPENTVIERCRINRINTMNSGTIINTTISSCYIDNEIDLNYNSEGIEISNCIILGALYNLESATIKNNVIIGKGRSYSGYILSDIKKSSIINNIILNTQDGYEVDENQKPYYYKNNTIKNISPSDNNVITNNVLSTDAEHAFADYPNNKFIGATPEDVFTMTGAIEEKYKLKDGSPAKGYGSNGYDCGAYSGQYPYVISGRPRFVPYIYEAVIPNKPTDGKLNVTLKIKTQNE